MSPTEEPKVEEVETPAASTSETMAACNALEKNPGGSFAMCANVSCEDLNGVTMMSYSEKEDVAACREDTFVGQCQMDDKLVTYFEGEPASLKMGCRFVGTWLEE